jgi:hypothetical protein
MRVEQVPDPESIAKRCVSKDEAIKVEIALVWPNPISRSTCVKPEDSARCLLYRGNQWRNLSRGCWMLRSKRDLKLLSTQVQREPNLVGTWINELGSRMRIDSVDGPLPTECPLR